MAVRRGSWLIDKKQMCPTCMQMIRGYCAPCFNKGFTAEQTYAQFVWKKEGEDGELVMTDIVGMVMTKQPEVRVSEDGFTAEFLNADGDVVMTATNTSAVKAAGEQSDELLK
tara:strand:- start:1966 stop:2301 length:336 start_codon:yes stop_codon:yes gene_type:complete